MLHQKKIVVVLPAYNAAETLERTYREIPFDLVDDVVLVDDVATTGKAIIEAKEALEKEGVICETAMVIVDRCEGAKENLKSLGLNLEAIFTIRDFGL